MEWCFHWGENFTLRYIIGMSLPQAGTQLGNYQTMWLLSCHHEQYILVCLRTIVNILEICLNPTTNHLYNFSFLLGS